MQNVFLRFTVFLVSFQRLSTVSLNNEHPREIDATSVICTNFYILTRFSRLKHGPLLEIS